jgi:hypothetical protein
MLFSYNLLSLKVSTGLSLGALLKDGLLDTTSLGKSHLWMVTHSDDEDVLQSGGEGVSLGILDCNNREGSLVFLNVHELSHTSSVTSLGDHDHGTEFELDNVRHLTSGDINLDGVIDLDIRVGVSQSASIVSDSNWDLVSGDINLGNAAELIDRFGFFDSVKDITSLCVEKETKAVARLVEFDDIHETSWVVLVSSDFSIHLDATFHANLHALLVGKCILQTITKDNGDREAFTQLVRTRGGSRSPDSAHFPEVPVLWSVEALQVLLWSASPVMEKEQDRVSKA